MPACMKRSSSAVWQGGLKDGKGTVSSERGALKEVAYNFSGRFEEGTHGTNPEELVAAAHASCFSMALSGNLEKQGGKPERIETRAVCTLEKKEAGWTVTAMHLDVEVRVEGLSEQAFRDATEAAKKGCPISRLLGGTIDITMDARLGK